MFNKAIKIAALGFVGSLFGFLCQILSAKYFGATARYDLFIIASTYPLFVSGLIMIVFHHYLVPEIAISENKLRDKFCYLIFLSFLILSIFIVIFGYFISPYQISYFDPSSGNEFVEISRIYWLAISLMPFIIFFQSLEIVNNNFTPVGISNLIPTLTTIILLYIFKNEFDLIILAYSLLGGNFLTLTYLCKINSLWPNFFKIRQFKFSRVDIKNLGSFYKKIPLIILTVLCYICFQVSDVFWCKFLPSSSLSYAAYSQRFLVAFLAVNISIPIQIVLPYLSNAIKTDDKNIAVLNMIKIFKISSVLILFQSIFFYFYSDNIIAILLQRGLFDEKATKYVALLLKVALFSGVFYSGAIIILRILLAKGLYKITAISGIFITLIYFIFSGIFTSFFGVVGLSIAFIFSWALYFLLLLFFLSNMYSFLVANKENYKFLIKIIVSNLLFFLVCFFLTNLIKNNADILFLDVIQLTIVFILMLLIYRYIIRCFNLFPKNDLFFSKLNKFL